MDSGPEKPATGPEDRRADVVDGLPAQPGSVAGGRGVQLGAHNTQVNVYAPAGMEVGPGAGPGAVPVPWPVRVGRAPLLADAFQDRPALYYSRGFSMSD
jgi:hypothetical protein